jgi:hypothetical protein
MAKVTIVFTDDPEDEFDAEYHYKPEDYDGESFSMAILLGESVKYLLDRGIVEDFIPAAIESLDSVCSCCGE